MEALSAGGRGRETGKEFRRFIEVGGKRATQKIQKEKGFLLKRSRRGEKHA